MHERASHNMKKIRVPKKDDVAGVLGHKGTFQVLSVDSRNRVVDLRSLEKRHVPAEVLEGFLGHRSCICHSQKNLRTGSPPGYRVEASIDHDSHTQNAMICGYERFSCQAVYAN